MLATCICLNGSLLDQLSCTIVYLHNLFTCTFGRINMSVCLSVCQSLKRYTKCSFEQITIENNIARAETDLNQFWQFWKRSQSKTSPMQV